MEITNEKEYEEVVLSVYNLMNKGEANLTNSESQQILEMAKAIEHYEDKVLKIMPLLTDFKNDKPKE